jgi:hypothetical protein
METHQFRNVCKTIVFYCVFEPQTFFCDFPALCKSPLHQENLQNACVFLMFFRGAGHGCSSGGGSSSGCRPTPRGACHSLPESAPEQKPSIRKIIKKLCVFDVFFSFKRLG